MMSAVVESVRVRNEGRINQEVHNSAGGEEI